MFDMKRYLNRSFHLREKRANIRLLIPGQSAFSTLVPAKKERKKMKEEERRVSFRV